MYVCMYVCMHVCMYVYMCVCMYVCMYACMYVSMYVCLYVGMYVCMYICMYHLSIHPSSCLSIYLSTHPPTYLLPTHLPVYFYFFTLHTLQNTFLINEHILGQPPVAASLAESALQINIYIWDSCKQSCQDLIYLAKERRFVSKNIVAVDC